MSNTIDNASELVWLRGKAVKFIAKLETAGKSFKMLLCYTVSTVHSLLCQQFKTNITTISQDI